MPVADLDYTVQGPAITFRVKIQPRASKNGFGGLIGGSLKIYLTAPPVDGAANAACIDFLAAVFRLAKSRVSILAGHTSRNKLIKIDGLPEEVFKAVLGKHL